jgi:hypothetical protein
MCSGFAGHERRADHFVFVFAEHACTVTGMRLSAGNSKKV